MFLYVFVSLESYHTSTSRKRRGDDECVVGTALSCACELLQLTGGKVMVFNFGLATVGQGALKNRNENPNLKNIENHHMLLKHANSYYLNCGNIMAKKFICTDFFAFSDGEVNYLSYFCKELSQKRLKTCFVCSMLMRQR